MGLRKEVDNSRKVEEPYKEGYLAAIHTGDEIYGVADNFVDEVNKITKNGNKNLKEQAVLGELKKVINDYREEIKGIWQKSKKELTHERFESLFDLFDSAKIDNSMRKVRHAFDEANDYVYNGESELAFKQLYFEDGKVEVLG